MKTICSNKVEVRGILFSILSSMAVLIVGFFAIDLIMKVDITQDTLSLFHGYFGSFVGYPDVNITALLSLSFAIGIVIGVGNQGIKEILITIITFFAIDFALFFGIGLLGLGHDYDYSILFDPESIMQTLVGPLIVIGIGSIFGYFAVKRDSRNLVDVSRY